MTMKQSPTKKHPVKHSTKHTVQQYPARALAAHCLTRIVAHQESLTQLTPLFQQHPEKSFVQALCFEVLRRYELLTAITTALLLKPIKAKDLDIQHLLLIGLNELTQQQTGDHACVNAVVEAAKILQKPWACALLNRNCREFGRRRDEYLQRFQTTALYPDWWLHAWQRDWPDHWQQIITANQQHPPMTLRINPQQVTRSHYLELLQRQGMAAQAHAHVPHAIELTDPVSVDRLPGFAQGWVSIQDAAAQLAAPLLDCQPQERVLDACSAPGGKTTHLFACQPQLAALVAVDNQPKRLEKVKENCARLNVTATCIAADVLDLAAWWDGVPFDKILLDAPCSGSGVIRRHPDIIYCRTPAMLATLAQQQLQLLETLWPILQPGGVILYVTCTISPEENERVIAQFCQQHHEAQISPLVLPYGHAQRYGWQILPGEGHSDGFYFARLNKAQ